MGVFNGVNCRRQEGRSPCLIVKIKVNSDWFLGCSLRVFPKGVNCRRQEGAKPLVQWLLAKRVPIEALVVRAFLSWLKRVKKIRVI